MSEDSTPPEEQEPTGAEAQSAPGPDEAAADPQSHDLRHAEEAIASVESAAAAVEAAAGSETDPAGGIDLTDLAQSGDGAEETAGINLLGDVALRVKIELGRTRMYVEDVLRLNTDSVIELDKAAGDPVDIFVNDRHVARGEVLVLNENFCVRVSEIINDKGSGEA